MFSRCKLFLHWGPTKLCLGVRSLQRGKKEKIVLLLLSSSASASFFVSVCKQFNCRREVCVHGHSAVIISSRCCCCCCAAAPSLGSVLAGRIVLLAAALSRRGSGCSAAPICARRAADKLVHTKSVFIALARF